MNDASPGRVASWFVTLGLALASALLFAIAWPPIGAWPAACVALAPFALACLQARSAWHLAIALLVAWSPAWLWLEWWIVQLTPPGLALLVVYCALYVVLAGILVRRFARAEATRRWPLAVLVPLAWVAVEFLRTTLVLGGYPWFQLGTALAGGPTGDALAAQSASLIGANGLSLLAAASGGALADLLRGREHRRRAILAFVAVALLHAANIGFGVWLVGQDGTRPGPRVLGLQTNLSVSNKIGWKPEDQVRDVRQFLFTTHDAVAERVARGETPDLVVWPETMVPGFGLEEQALDLLDRGGYYPRRAYADALARLHEAIHTPLLVGAGSYLGLRVEPELEEFRWDRHYNSAYLVTGAPPYRRYDKLVLTPFGEEMPLISRWDWLESRLLSIAAPGMRFDLDAGEAPVRFDIPFGGGQSARVATPICFEDTVPSLCRRLVYEGTTKVADLLVNLSNDGWFGWSATGRAQHVLHARLRSIELAVPMVRCVNTGLSVLIDDHGRVTAWIGTQAPGDSTIAGVLDAPTRLSDRSTPYGWLGDIGPWTALAGAAFLVVRSRRTGGTPTAAEAK